MLVEAREVDLMLYGVVLRQEMGFKSRILQLRRVYIDISIELGSIRQHLFELNVDCFLLTVAGGMLVLSINIVHIKDSTDIDPEYETKSRRCPVVLFGGYTVAITGFDIGLGLCSCNGRTCIMALSVCSCSCSCLYSSSQPASYLYR